MKVLAVLQNPGFAKDTDPELVRKYALDDEFRRKTLSTYKTGQRLILSMGKEAFDKVIWENATLILGRFKKVKNIADIEHIYERMMHHRPDVIVSYGEVARIGVAAALAVAMENGKTIVEKIIVYNCEHPNKRGITREQLEVSGTFIRNCVNGY